MLDESAAQHNLEHIATQTVLNASTDVLTMLIICQGRAHIAYRVEIVCFYIGLVHGLYYIIELGLAFQRNKLDGIIKVVEHNHHLI